MIMTENDLWERDVSADFHEAMKQMRAEPAPTDSVDRLLMTAARLNGSGTLTTDRQPNSGGSKKSNLVSTQNGPVSNRAFFTGRATMITLKTLAAAVLVIGGIAWFENTGNPKSPWLRHPLKDHWPNAVTLILADLDRDGRLDIIATAERGANELRYWHNEPPN